MKAMVVKKNGGPKQLKRAELPQPKPNKGWVLIQVKAFGLNRSELYTRRGLSTEVKLPRVLGVECVGRIAEDPEGLLPIGQQVMALMGGMGEVFDGSYAEYCVVPREIVFPFESGLNWATLAAIPQMFQTAQGSLHKALAIRKGETVLIRGGSSSIGMLSITLAKLVGTTVIATTRNAKKLELLKKQGADTVLLDEGPLADAVWEHAPEGVDKVQELIGGAGLKDSLLCCRPGGIVCLTGCLSENWVWKNFEPWQDLPSSVKLTAYHGQAKDLSANQIQQFIGQIEKGSIQLKIDHIFNFDEIIKAHEYMESNQAKGKLVVLLN